MADAKYWQPMLEMVQRKWGTLGGLMCHFSANDDRPVGHPPRTRPSGTSSLAELYWHRDFLARGELEKALLVLYSSLVYGMSEDMYETVERVNIADSNYAPFQPNSSGNGRVLAMLRRMVIDEQDEAKGTLWLLRGCPRRWFAPGKSISVSDAPTVFGKMALRTDMHGSRHYHRHRPPGRPGNEAACASPCAIRRARNQERSRSMGQAPQWRAKS